MKSKYSSNYWYLLVIWLFVCLFAAGCGRFEMDASVKRIDIPTPVENSALRAVTPTSTAAAEPTITAEAITPQSESAAAAEQETGNDDPEAASSSQPTLDATYQDNTAGIAMDYPSQWEVIDMDEALKSTVTNYTTTFNSWRSGPGSGGIPEGETKIDLIIRANIAGSLEEASAIRRGELQGAGSESTILSEEEVTLHGGLKGTRFRTQSQFGESAHIVTSINNHLITVGGLGDEALIEQIAKTLRPLDNDSADFEPYPVMATDVRAIRVADTVEMAPIYSGPGADFVQAAGVESGMALAVSGITEDGRWYQLTGCKEQNPFRPAPSCWISTAQEVSQPIRGIDPSQQPVVTSDAQAVLIVTNEFMAPVYSGPDETYPRVSQLASGFSFPVIGMSEDGHWWRLEGCSSPLNEELDECWISADPSMTEPLDELIPHGPQLSAPQQPVGPSRSGTTTVTELPRCFDLDAGTVGAVANPNCEFNMHPHEAEFTLIFEPIQPSRFGFSGVFPEPPTEAMCAGSQHLSGSSEVIAPLASFYICYQTGEGRFGYLHFLDMTNEPLTVTLEWHTYGE